MVILLPFYRYKIHEYLKISLNVISFLLHINSTVNSPSLPIKIEQVFLTRRQAAKPFFILIEFYIFWKVILLALNRCKHWKYVIFNNEVMTHLVKALVSPLDIAPL